MDSSLFLQWKSGPHGLSDAEAEKRLAKYGLNLLREKKKKPLILQFLEEFKDLMVAILIFAAGLSFFLGDTKDATVIFIILIINAGIGFFQKYRAEKALDALKKLLTQKTAVLRNGEEKVIDAVNLVPGDIVILREGDKVPADGALVEERELTFDESILTGESLPVKKKISETVCMGTQVTHGRGKMLITQTGMATEFGKIATLTTETKKDKSPLQKELHGIGVYIWKVTFGLSAILIIGGFFVQHRPLVESILFAASVAVAAVPEGLPATITVAMALGVQRLAKKNAIVKQLTSVETLGSTTVICSDKTGTLTKNELTVREIIIGPYHGRVEGVGYEPRGLLHIHNHGGEDYECGDGKCRNIKEKNPVFFEELLMFSRIAGLCNESKLVFTQEKWMIIGDPTEGALLTFIEKIGFSQKQFLQEYERVFDIPFDSERKRMSILYRHRETKHVMAFMKGAPEVMLPLCEISEQDRKIYEQKNHEMAKKALRVLGFAFRDLEVLEDPTTMDEKNLEHNFQFIGMAGMIDPPREEVKTTVMLTKKAGIRTYIVTGDHGLTAHAIARELGLATTEETTIITGKDFQHLSDGELRKLFKQHKEIIFARVNPGDKLRIVNNLKAQGEIVAVTGDGVNDAPALKRADIGVAMGGGTEVSKEASNMILTDDSFATIVNAIREGRNIYENMKKFIFFIFSSNIGELVIIFAALLFGMLPPLTAILILAVNVGTDIFPALALGIEPPETDIMDVSPRRPETRIMNKKFISRYLFIGSFIGLVVTAGYFWALFHRGYAWGMPLEEADIIYRESATFAFALLVMVEMVNAFNARSDHESVFRMNFFSNGKLLLSVIASLLLTVAFVHVPFLQHALETLPLDTKEWLMIVIISLSVLIVEEIRKYFVRKKRLAYAS